MEKIMPKVVSDKDRVWGNVKGLMPPYNEIPEEFKDGNTKWNRVFNDWFFEGLHKCQWVPKEGIEAKTAVRHIATIMSSFDPKHEHKEAACAYLMSLWFDNVSYEIEKD